uniref:Lipocalin/cytosolic fatty-acid binding domain-containing protein n=1 Tax=Photinus pyralis TaxID=7054 RepID=A0A1Y1K813_PHOPY
MIAQVLLISLAVTYATSPPQPPRPEPSKCPHDESFPGLDMTKMKGRWHVAAASTTIPLGDRGLVKPIQGQTVTITGRPGENRLIHSVGKRQPFTHEYTIVQEEREINAYTPERVNELKFAVVATDYDNVALIVTCEQHFTDNRVARVLVRHSARDNQRYLDQMYEHLPGRGFQIENMEKVEM